MAEVIVVLVEEDVIEENAAKRREATNERLTQKQQ